MITQFAQVGDQGLALVYQFIAESTGFPIDVSAATLPKIKLGLPDGTTSDKVAALLTNGLDGKIVYVTTTNDLPQAGIYTVQGKVTLLSKPIHGEVQKFEVRANVDNT